MAGGVSSTEIPFQPEARWSVPWLLADRIARSGDRPLVARKSPLSGDWQEVSARAFGEEVAHVAAGLIGMGLEAGTAVGIMAHTSYDWFLLDMAIARAGLPPDRLAMVGDTLHTDVLGGAAAGCRSVLVTDHGLFTEAMMAAIALVGT